MKKARNRKKRRARDKSMSLYKNLEACLVSFVGRALLSITNPRDILLLGFASNFESIFHKFSINVGIKNNDTGERSVFAAWARLQFPSIFTRFSKWSNVCDWKLFTCIRNPLYTPFVSLPSKILFKFTFINARATIFISSSIPEISYRYKYEA